MGLMTNESWAGFCEDIAKWGVYDTASPGVEQDGRPEVLYKPLGSIQVGEKAYIVASLPPCPGAFFENGLATWTSVVAAHDRVTGAFETKYTRYVLDNTNYVH